MSRRVLIPIDRSPEELAVKRLQKIADGLGLGMGEEITAEHFSVPIVYVWMRGTECLYVGQSRAGFQRLFQRHHVITALEPGDTIHYWIHNGSADERRRVEYQLIARLRPKLNDGGKWTQPVVVEPTPHVVPLFKSTIWRRMRGGK